MAQIFYWVTKGTPSERPIYGVHSSGQPVPSGLPPDVASLEVTESPDVIAWPVPANASRGREAWTVVDMTNSPPTLRVDSSLAPIPTDADRFDAEGWIKATNLYWLGVVTQLVAGLNQVRQNPTQTHPAATAPTIAEVKAGVVAKYQMLVEP